MKTHLEFVQSKRLLRIPSLSVGTVGACPPFPGPHVPELLQRHDVLLPVDTPAVVLMEVPWELQVVLMVPVVLVKVSRQFQCSHQFDDPALLITCFHQTAATAEVRHWKLWQTNEHSKQQCCLQRPANCAHQCSHVLDQEVEEEVVY